MTRPLFLGDPARVAHKLETASGLLGGYWADFLAKFRAKRGTSWPMVHLPAALLGEGVDEAREQLRAAWRYLGSADTAGDFQFHTWCRCGAETRRAAFFDWFAHRGLWSRAEVEEAAECFLGFAFKHPFAVLHARGRSSNNQAISMALHLAVVGFIFGHKLADHPTGKFLFDYGLGRLPDLIGLFPADGYGGEGSTYTSHVNTPLAYWTAEFLRQVLGRDFLDVPFRPNGTTLRRMVEMELRITSPGGLLAPWDHYGWQPGINASPFAYLARTTGDPNYLSLIPALGLWEHDGYLAWGMDDPMWTLLWWPEEFKDYADAKLPAKLFGWFLPRTGAALDDCKRRTRLMQVWDRSGETIAVVGRLQVNPNHLMLDYAGEPVFQDGIQEGERDPWGFPPDKVLERLGAEERERYLAYLASIGIGKEQFHKVVLGIAPGLLGVANAIVVDEEPWYWPGGERVGKPEFYAAGGGLQGVTADCASFYQPRYGVSRARRSSVWTGAGFGLVVDTLEAASDHIWRWQAYLRPNVEMAGESLRIRLTNGRSVLLAWEPGAEVRTTPVEGFPRTEEKRSLRLDLLQRGPTARFVVLIAPEARSASVRSVDDSTVEASIDGQTHLLRVESRRGAVGEVRPDTHELSDIESDRDLQLAEFEAAVRWACAQAPAGNTLVERLDACLAQTAAARPDAEVLVAALESPSWPVQVAAAEAIGRRIIQAAAPALRKLLEAEHARPTADVYPPEDAQPGERTVEDMAKRWRLKVALIVALGRLRDAAAVPLLGRILADGRDFYAVYSVAAQALGRIGGQAALDALAPAFRENEVNTHSRALFAKAAIERQGARE
ncbi:MAG: hypothetical protein FJ291_10150 [Planctomycetes bacterium]|nr:hypothetical protein [Planctomycetota bacterium]